MTPNQPGTVSAAGLPLAQLRALFDARFEYREGIHTTADVDGYWSNIDPDEQRQLLAALETGSYEQVVSEKLARLERFVNSPARSAGLQLLSISPEAVGVDYGCMWGNLLVAAARRCRAMVGVDKTTAHLQFLTHRLRSEQVDNVLLLNADLRNPLPLADTFDFAIVNGVLEWIPVDIDIAINRVFGSRRVRFVKPRTDPRAEQLAFLRRVQRSLKLHGEVYVAIENRYDYQCFLWKKDPHANQMFTTWLPRRLANLASNLVYGRPYWNYLYSARELERLLGEAGFDRVRKYVAFPNYRHPQIILPLGGDASGFRPIYSERPTRNPLKMAFRRGRRGLDTVIFQRLGWLQLAPAFIFVARKQ